MLWTGKLLDSSSYGRNAVFYGNKAIDRSPCGTGTSARMAQLYFKGKLGLGERALLVRLLRERWPGKPILEKYLHHHKIRGWAKMYGDNTITIDTYP